MSLYTMTKDLDIIFHKIYRNIIVVLRLYRHLDIFIDLHTLYTDIYTYLKVNEK